MSTSAWLPCVCVWLPRVVVVVVSQVSRATSVNGMCSMSVRRKVTSIKEFTNNANNYKNCQYIQWTPPCSMRTSLYTLCRMNEYIWSNKWEAKNRNKWVTMEEDKKEKLEKERKLTQGEESSREKKRTEWGEREETRREKGINKPIEDKNLKQGKSQIWHKWQARFWLIKTNEERAQVKEERDRRKQDEEEGRKTNVHKQTNTPLM